MVQILRMIETGDGAGFALEALAQIDAIRQMVR
jgi:hypothetical protein